MRITDHAKIRFLERVLGIDIESVFVQELLDEEVANKINLLGEGIYPSRDGQYRLVVRGNQIVSILSPGMKARGRLKRCT